jgi:uncharacterized protein YcbK (DUF882 family)
MSGVLVSPAVAGIPDDTLQNDMKLTPKNLSGRGDLSRRQFVALGALAASSLLVPRSLQAAVAAPPGGEKELSFFHTHTNETLQTAYCCDGQYQPAALAQVNHFLRDFRVNEEHPIDPKLLDLLFALGTELQTRDRYHVISGYRSPETNSMLRERGGEQTGVAVHSLHMVGKAIDIRVPSVPLAELRKAATSLKLGGVGFYPNSNFVHVDVGRVRYWSGS